MLVSDDLGTTDFAKSCLRGSVDYLLSPFWFLSGNTLWDPLYLYIYNWLSREQERQWRLEVGFMLGLGFKVSGLGYNFSWDPQQNTFGLPVRNLRVAVITHRCPAIGTPDSLGSWSVQARRARRAWSLSLNPINPINPKP